MYNYIHKKILVRICWTFTSSEKLRVLLSLLGLQLHLHIFMKGEDMADENWVYSKGENPWICSKQKVA